MGASGPANASLNAQGFRWYQWEKDDGEIVKLLSVTSIRKLTGENFNLVNWQIGNVLDTVMGTVKRPAIGKRGKPLKGKWTYVPENPGEMSDFVRMYIEADGVQGKLDALRSWTREQADKPRNIAAIRGTIVHTALERNVAADRVNRDWVEATFLDLSPKDRAKRPLGVLDEDVTFVERAVANYWDMRRNVPFIIIAREPQVFNLEAGYAGSADTIIWFLPKGMTAADIPLRAHELTLPYIQSIGGFLAVGDWKTSNDIHTDNVIQVHAYGGAEFVGEDGLINHRLTAILRATLRGVVFHIRPDKWGAYVFDFNEPTFRAFYGSVAFARFQAEYPYPGPLFIESYTGSAEEAA